jgi:Pyruvate/2-oxoacid:ferredoxin oxidoreductase gamma subunit
MRLDVCVGGSGGQGVLLFSTAILHAAVQEGKRAMCLPSYGAEARGGEVSCFLIISDSLIRSPFAEKVDYLVFFNSGSFSRFREHLRPEASLLYNAAEAPDGLEGQLPAGLRAIAVPLAKLVAGLDRRCENMAMLGVFVQLIGILDFGQLAASFRRAYQSRGESFLGPNLRAIEAGREWARAKARDMAAEGVSDARR